MAFLRERLDAWRMTGAALGAAAGLWLALPVADVQQVCPAPGEGRTQCVLNEVWLTIGLHVLLLAMLGALVAQLALAAPSLLRARRDGTLLGEVAPMRVDDELLVAATWDRTYVSDGRTPILRAPRVRWSDPDAAAAPETTRARRFVREPLPVDADGRLAPDDLRAWLREEATPN